MARIGRWQMRKRFSIPLALLLLLAMVTLLVWAANTWIVQPAFDRLEQVQANEDASRAWRAIQREVTQLGGELGDWANWDDLHDFAERQDPAFIRANLGDWGVLERTSAINLCFIVNRDGAVLYSDAYDSDFGGSVALPSFMGEATAAKQLMEPVFARDASVDGILLTKHGLMLIAGRPILTTEGKGPSQGGILFGRFFDAAMLSTLVQQTRVGFEVLLSGTDRLMPEEVELLAHQTTGVAEFHRTAGGAFVYQVLTDVVGKRVALIRAPVRQEISVVGRETGRVMAVVLILALSGLIGAVVLAFLGIGGLISLQAQRDLGGAGTNQDIKRRHALWLAGAIGVYVLGVAVYARWSSQQARVEMLRQVDQQLLLAAQVAKHLLPDDFHDRATGPGAIMREEERRLRQVANRFIRDSNLENIYTVVMRDDRLYFTWANVALEQARERESWYFYPYDGAPKEFPAALRERRAVFASYRDEWGAYRSVAVPEVSPGGQLYLACADYSLPNIQAVMRRRALQTAFMAMGFLALAFPFLLVYRKAFAAFAYNLRSSEASYRGLFDTVNEAIFILDRDGRFVTVNHGAEVMYGRPGDWFIGRSLCDAGAPEKSDQEDMSRAVAEAFAGKPQRVEWWGVDARGRVFPKDVRLSRGTYFGQDVVIKLAEDITARRGAETERLNMERRLLHSQKLESLGVLAGGIAHDFNNLLMAMLGNLDLALSELPPGAASIGSINGAIHAARRAADLTRQMLAYSGRGKFIVQLVNLTDIVAENVHLFRASIPKTVALDMQLAKDLMPIEADAGQLQQVVMNLIINAAEAIGDQPGTITISTSMQSCTEEYLAGSRTGERIAAGRYACLDVVDTGCGMGPEIQERLFEPFYSTKATGRGLGMPAVLGIMRAHQGAVLVESAPGKGTTLRILFPVVAAEIDQAGEAAKGAAPVPKMEDLPPGKTKGLVLVVDDEESVRLLCARMVERLGYTVITAVDGLDAVAVFREHAEELAAVLMDLSMPKMDGVAAHQAMVAIRPDARIILCSGFSKQDATERFIERGLAGFIQKPYDLKALRQVLEGGGGM